MGSRRDAQPGSPSASTPLGRLAENTRWRHVAGAPSLLSAPNVADALRHFKGLTRGATRRLGDTLSAQERCGGRLPFDRDLHVTTGRRWAPGSRRRSQYSDQNYYYGEILFESLAVLLHRVRRRCRRRCRCQPHVIAPCPCLPAARSKPSTGAWSAKMTRWWTSAPG